MKRMTMPEAEWAEMNESYLGYCTKCGDWTRDTTEPDARGYDCPVCSGHNTVYGAEESLIMGLIEFGEG